MIFLWSLSDNKSPQVSRTILSILANLNNAVVWMISNCPLISTSSSPFINPLLTVPSAPRKIGNTINFMFHGFFSSLARSTYFSLFSLPFSFTRWSAGRVKSTIRWVLISFFFFLFFFSFFVDYHLVRSSGRNDMIRLYLRIPENFVRLVLYDGFLVVHIQFVHMSKFEFPT